MEEKGKLGPKISQNRRLSAPEKVLSLKLLAQVHGDSCNLQPQVRVVSTGNLVSRTRLTAVLNSGRNGFRSINLNTREIIYVNASKKLRLGLSALLCSWDRTLSLVNSPAQIAEVERLPVKASLCLLSKNNRPVEQS